MSEWLDDTIFVGLGLVEAARIAVANPDLHIMGELPALPDNIDALVRAAQTTGLFGLRAAAGDLTPALLSGLPAGGAVHHEPADRMTSARWNGLIRSGVNFIETARPDITSMLLPAGEAEPHQIPLMRY